MTKGTKRRLNFIENSLHRVLNDYRHHNYNICRFNFGQFWKSTFFRVIGEEPSEDAYFNNLETQEFEEVKNYFIETYFDVLKDFHENECPDNWNG